MAERRSDTASRAYLDHASSSPLRPIVLEAMLPYLREHHGDPGRVHHEGRTTRMAVEQARQQVADLVGARPREVVFTSSGTEAVNSAVWGALERSRERTPSSGLHVVTTAVEHSSVLDSVRREDVPTTMISVDGHGRFSADAVVDAITPETVLVSVQLANHEVGTLQPAAEVAVACRERKVICHVDACAAIGYRGVDFGALGADLCSITAHKWGGPKGIGALLVRRGLRIPPLIVGGAQERARRGGIENVPAMVGFGAAAEELGTVLSSEAERLRALTETLAQHSLEAVPGLTRFGDPDRRVPHVVCFGIEGVEAEPVLLGLDQRGVAVHSGSSCSSETLEPSPVLEAMGLDAERSLRVSVGWSTTEADVDAFVAALPPVVEGLRSLRG